MAAFKTRGHLRLLAGGVLASALCFGAAAVAQEPAPSLYICLSNGCVPQTPVNAPRAPAAPATRASSNPATSAASRAAMLAGMQAGIEARLLEGLTPQQRASAQVSQSVDGDRVTVDVEYQGPNGRGRISRMMRMPSN